MPDACLKQTNKLSCYLGGMVRVDMRLVAAGIAALGVGVAIFVGSQMIDGSDARVARLETEVASQSAVEETMGTSQPFAANAPLAFFDERFYFGQRLASFDERFAGAFPGTAAADAVEGEEHADELQQRLDAKSRLAVAPPTPQLAPVPTSPLASVRDKRLRTAEALVGMSLPLDAGSHTAIYDIVARTVYLPNGEKLEAHSGLGSHLDDPRYVNTKGQGPTPPNVYSLALRERLFHGVRAIRLIPVDDGKMFGRDGMLAHTYMLGPTGQSNGCVSFRNYSTFLNAFLRGEVDRLVVVDHLAKATDAKTKAANRG